MRRITRTRLIAVGLPAVLVAALVVSPALGGPSLKKLVKKEVAKQLAGKVGPPGAQGPQGAAGAPGTPGSPGVPGPTASAAGTANPEPDVSDIGIAALSSNTQTLVTTNVTTTGASRIVATGSVAVGATAAGPPHIECQIRIDGTLAGVFIKEVLEQTFHTVTFTGAATVGAGAHTVDAQCRRSSGAGTVGFQQGNITAIAAAV
jgi:hypothetical protein